MAARTNREDSLKRIEEEYIESGLEEKCEEMIRIVTPQLELIGEQMEEKYGRPIVQYITSRVKTPESILNKLIRKRRSQTLDKAVETFNDLAGIRVVCTFYDDVYSVVKAIRKISDIKVEKVRDYIAHPKPSGYRSIHIITQVPECGPIRLEIQVCSAAMNYWAMLDHQLSYKNLKGDREERDRLEKELKSYSFEIKDIDKKFLKIRKMIEKLGDESPETPEEEEEPEEKKDPKGKKSKKEKK